MLKERTRKLKRSYHVNVITKNKAKYDLLCEFLTKHKIDGVSKVHTELDYKTIYHVFVNNLTDVYKITLEEFIGRSRKREVVYARQHFFKIMRDNTKMSLEGIGDIINRSHCSVIHSLKEFEKNMNYTDYSKPYREMKKLFEYKN